MSPDRVARHQKARLEGAMVEATARHGYAGTTLRELVALAGVSKTTFYEHFDSKQDCFLSTFDTIIATTAERVSAAYREPGDFRQRLVAALATFMEMVVEEPAAAALASVESLALGTAGVAHRERNSQAFELMIRQSFEHSPSQLEVSNATIRAIVAGVRGVVYRRLRVGRQAELPGLVDELVDWALRYQEPGSEAVRRACDRAGRPAGPELPAQTDPTRLDWAEPPDSPRSRAELTQRERIVRAAGRLAVKEGFLALSIPAISGAAGVSNQTFYEHFSNKREPLLEAFELSAAECLEFTAAALKGAGDRPEAIGAGVRALLEHVAGNEIFARISFFELQTAGPVALDRADSVMDRFTAFLRSGSGPDGIGAPPPPVVVEAVGSGIWSVIQHEIAHDRADSLTEMAPELTRIAMAPFGIR
jgi:AcrR family transcriptional regulator